MGRFRGRVKCRSFVQIHTNWQLVKYTRFSKYRMNLFEGGCANSPPRKICTNCHEIGLILQVTLLQPNKSTYNHTKMPFYSFIGNRQCLYELLYFLVDFFFCIYLFVFFPNKTV